MNGKVIPYPKVERTDPWCKPIISDTGRLVFGGAARNVRIKRGGGMEKILFDAGNYVLNNINNSHLRKV